jgi:putative transposase
MTAARPVLRVGDRVGFDGDEHLVTGLAGTQVRLRADSGTEQVILAGRLMAAPDFELLDTASLPEIEPFCSPRGRVRAGARRPCRRPDQTA